jgi:hypothetical protein
MNSRTSSYHRYRYPREIISHRSVPRPRWPAARNGVQTASSRSLRNTSSKPSRGTVKLARMVRQPSFDVGFVLCFSKRP